MISIETRYKVDKIRPRSWSGVYGYPSDNQRMKDIFGELYAVMTISSEVEFDFNNVAKLVLDEIQDSYYQQGMVEVGLDHFEDALRQMKTRLENILAREITLANSGIDIQAAVMAIKEGVMFVATIGESKIYIARGEEVNEISQALQDPDLDGFMNTGSLVLKDDDRILLATDSVPVRNSEEAIVEGMDTFQIDDWHVQDGAALLLGYNVDMSQIHQPIPPVEPAKQEETEADDTEDETLAATAAELDTDVDMDLAEAAVEAATAAREPIELEELADAEENDIEDDQVENQGVAEVAGEDDRSNGVDAEDVEPHIVSRSVPKPETDYFDTPLAAKLKSAFDLAKNRVQDLRVPDSAKQAAARFTPVVKQKAGQIKEWSVKQFNNIKENVSSKPGDSRLPSSRGRAKLPADLPGKALELVKGRGLVILAVLLVLILGYGGYSAYRNSQINAARDLISEQIGALQEDVTQIDQNASSNPTGIQEDLSALETVEQNLPALRSAEYITQEQIASIDAVQAQIQDIRDSLQKVIPVAASNVVADLAALYEGAQAAAITFVEGRLYIVDQARGVLYSTGTGANSNVTELASGLTRPFLVDGDNENNVVVVDEDSSSVLAKFSPESGELQRLVGFSPDTQGKLTTFDVWANAYDTRTNGALYGLSANRNAIVRQFELNGSYQLPNYSSPWRNDPEFRGAVDMVVDYSIYVLIEGSGLKRYFSGEDAGINFIDTLPADQSALAGARAVAASRERIFVADPANRRVLSFLKDLINDPATLTFEGQYVYRGDSGSTFTNITDIAVSDNGNNLFILDNNRIIKLSRANF